VSKPESRRSGAAPVGSRRHTRRRHDTVRPGAVRGRPLPKPRLDRTAPPRAEIVSIGRELLRGRVPDDNAPRLAEVLSGKGALIHRITIVDDTTRSIAAAITEALDRGSRLIVTTGGLGPGADDRTLEAIAAALQRPLSLHPGAKRMVESAYRRLCSTGRVATEGLNAAREKMCSIPVGGEPVENPLGPAPGVLVRLPGATAVLALPGAPGEAQAVLEAALPGMRELFLHGFIAQREVETPIEDESVLRPMLDRLVEEHPGLWIKSLAPGFGRGDARITVTLEATASTRHAAELAVEGALRRLLALAGGGR
jgi:nicotinamide-nucleotide amidase